MPMPFSSVLDDLEPLEQQRLKKATHEAALAVSVASDAGVFGRTALLAARESAAYEAGVTGLESLGREDLIEEWGVERCQQHLVAMTHAAMTTSGTSRVQSATSQALSVDLLSLVRAWRDTLGPERLAAAASVPFTSPHGRESSLVDRMAQTPGAYEAALDLMAHGALASSFQSLLHAIVHHREDLLDALLNAGAPANGPFVARQAIDLPLGLLAQPGSPGDPERTSDGQAVREMNHRIGETLIAHGADVNRVTETGSVLRAAVHARNAERAAWLLDHGATLDESWTVRSPDTRGNEREPDRTLHLSDLITVWVGEHHAQHPGVPMSASLHLLVHAQTQLWAHNDRPGPDGPSVSDSSPTLGTTPHVGPDALTSPPLGRSPSRLTM